MANIIKRRPRLLFFHTECTQLRGGEKFIYELTTGMAKTHSVVLFVENISQYWKEQYRKQRIIVVQLWKPPFFYWLLLPVTLIINFCVLRKRLTVSDTIFATNFPLSFLATRLSKKAIVFCFEPLSVFYDRVRIRSLAIKDRLMLGVARLLYAPLDRLAIMHSWVLATLNTSVAEAVAKKYGRGADVLIPNGVDSNAFSPSALPLYKKDNKQRFIIGHSTDYTVLKGTELLLRSLPPIIKNNKSVFLLLSESVHNTQERKKYQRLIRRLGIQKYVRFVGCVPEKHLPGFYTSCDVFCYCGSTRCVGGSSASLSVIESSSCGVPVLRTKGNVDEIIHGKTGYYIPSETPASVAKTIVSFMELAPEKVHDMKKQARTYVIKTFSWQTSIKTLTSLI